MTARYLNISSLTAFTPSLVPDLALMQRPLQLAVSEASAISRRPATFLQLAQGGHNCTHVTVSCEGVQRGQGARPPSDAL